MDYRQQSCPSRWLIDGKLNWISNHHHFFIPAPLGITEAKSGTGANAAVSISDSSGVNITPPQPFLLPTFPIWPGVIWPLCACVLAHTFMCLPIVFTRWAVGLRYLKARHLTHLPLRHPLPPKPYYITAETGASLCRPSSCTNLVDCPSWQTATAFFRVEEKSQGQRWHVERKDHVRPVM